VTPGEERSDAIRVALLADSLEEGFASMDHYAAMLGAALADRPDVNALLTRPLFRRRFARAGGLLGRRAIVLDRLVNRYRDYPRAAAALPGFDLFHVLDQTYASVACALPAPRTLVTCHDLDFFDPPPGTRHAWLVRRTGAIALPGLRHAARVICDSDAIRRDILGRGLVSDERLRVVPLGAEPDFRPDGPEVLGPAAEQLLASRTPPLVLHVGGMVPRKRIDLVLGTFACLRAGLGAATLVRVGGALTPSFRQLAQTLGIAQAIVEMPFLTRSQLAALYRRCQLLLLVSETEGFGLPVLEAMASGVPVVCRDLPALRELAGDAARLVPGDDPVDFAAACTELLGTGSTAASLRARGLARARDYSWDRTGELTARVYAELRK